MHKLQHDIKVVVKQSVLRWNALLPFTVKTRINHESKKKELNIQIGKRLQIARENSGYTQEAFAEALDIGVEHYRKIELGMYGLQRENMLILYEKYKIDPTYLITGEKNLAFDVEIFLANCSREERDKFIDRMLAYMRKLIINLQ